MRHKVYIALTVTVNIWCSNAEAQWDVVFKDTTDMAHYDLFFIDKDTGFIVGSSSLMNSSYVLKTLNGGIDWDTTFFVNENFWEIDFPNRDTGYIAYADPFTVSVRRSVDGGETWQAVTNGLLVGNTYLTIKFFNGKTGVLSVNGWSWKTIDAGQNWSIIGTNPNGGGTSSFILDSLYVDANGGWVAYTTDSCLTYQRDTAFYANSESVMFKNGEVVVAGIGQGGTSLGYPNLNYGVIGIGQLGDDPYNEIHFPEIYDVLHAEKTDNYYYGGTWPFTAGLEFIKSEDGGASWYSQNTTEPGGFSGGWVTAIQCLNDSVCYAIAAGNIYKTTNGGGPLISLVNSVYLDVDEELPSYELQIFPNPNDGMFAIELPHDSREIVVSNLLGEIIQRQAVVGATALINLSSDPKGLYLIIIATEKGIYSNKVVVE